MFVPERRRSLHHDRSLTSGRVASAVAHEHQHDCADAANGYTEDDPLNHARPPFESVR